MRTSISVVGPTWFVAVNHVCGTAMYPIRLVDPSATKVAEEEEVVSLKVEGMQRLMLYYVV